MDALAQLALMTKAKLVFENPDSFLSFPVLSPVSYKANELKFDSPNLTAGQLLALSDFSRAVNSRFTDTIFQMEADIYLWDTYQQVLSNAILARDLASAEDTAAFNEAVALLTTKGENGLVTDSVAMSTYKQYRDASFKATQDYKTQQLTAESSSDPVVQSQWLTIDEPRLRALKQQAEGDWRANGSKEQIERALQVQQTHASRSPQTTWRQWTALFDPSIDIQTDTNTQEFALTSYAPQGIFDQDWPTFHLTRAEISQLAEQAPAELRDKFAIEGSSSTVEALSFEYRSVALTRPWFRPAVFEARFWRLPDASTVLSDGGNPSQGAWPAYAAALVFVRNISLTMRGAANQPAPELFRGSVLTLNPALLRPRQCSPRVTGGHKAEDSSTNNHGPPMTAGIVADNSRIAMARPSTMFARPGITITPRPASSAVLLRLRGNAFQTLPIATAGPGASPPSPSSSTNTTTQQGTRDEVSILAFICKRLPKSPNPDPTLTW